MGERETAYILKLHVYTDMTDGKRGVRQGKWVFMGIEQSRFGSWRGVTVNTFSSVGMAEELFTKK
jgi:hypothetical protein